ncbi:hypothetical protein JAAARDRAFT_45675 [Jaapia argillacea MUCL 33604]|uniref:Proteasome assembly chaperone 3 n=1 Tax=Jaapia argillacea MUCL 33604 TaxID=933084 RepID=A0A067Q4B3_9AGAM|nr:hypothetical protein JAAARDRAFT_45675 [Jaapia argillacea MUCL 33604]
MLEDVATDVVVQQFADRILVLVTQLGKVGSLIQASIPPTSVLPSVPPPNPNEPEIRPLPPPPPAIQLTPLFGTAPSEHMQTMHSLYVSQIATIVWVTKAQGIAEGTPRRNVVVGIALKRKPEGLSDSGRPYEKAVFCGVMDMLREILES